MRHLLGRFVKSRDPTKNSISGMASNFYKVIQSDHVGNEKMEHALLKAMDEAERSNHWIGVGS